MYLVIISDRHTDDEYALYADSRDAMERARKECDEITRHYREAPQEYLSEAMEKEGWMFHAGLEDCGSVSIKEIDAQ